MNDPIQEELAELFRIQLEAEEPDLDQVEANEQKVGRDAEESLELGRLQLGANDIDGALVHFRRAETQGGDKAVVHEAIAGALEYSDRETEAFREYRRLGKDSPEAQVGIAAIYRRHGRFRDSAKELERTVIKDPSNAFVQFKLAQTLRDSGQKRRALEEGLKAVSLDPEQAFFHFWIGDLLVEMRRYDDSIDFFRAALALSPGDDYFCLRSSVAFWGGGKPKEAIRAIRLAIELDPEKTLYFGVLEMYLRLDGQSEEANQEADRVARMDRYDREQLDRIRAELLLA